MLAVGERLFLFLYPGHDIGRYGIAWLKLYLDGDERYWGFIYGAEAKSDRDRFSRYVTHP